jgi:putative monooxygenase
MSDGARTGPRPTRSAVPPPAEAIRVVAARDVPPDCRRGGELRVLLGPKTVGSTSGFMGVARLLPGERIGEHYHPYSEEFLYVTKGQLVVDLDDQAIPLGTGEALFIPIRARHRLRNTGYEPAEAVFQLGPLAPRPELGHVDTEAAARSVPDQTGPDQTVPEQTGPEQTGPEQTGPDQTGPGQPAGKPAEAPA